MIKLVWHVQQIAVLVMQMDVSNVQTHIILVILIVLEPVKNAQQIAKIVFQTHHARIVKPDLLYKKIIVLIVIHNASHVQNMDVHNAKIITIIRVSIV